MDCCHLCKVGLVNNSKPNLYKQLHPQEEKKKNHRIISKMEQKHWTNSNIQLKI